MLCDLARREHKVDKAKLHSLAEEKRSLEAKVKQLEGEISSLQSVEAAQESVLVL